MLSAESSTGKSLCFFYDEDDLLEEINEIAEPGELWDLFRDGRLYSHYIPWNYYA